MLWLQGIPCVGIDECLATAVGPHAKLHRILQRTGLPTRATNRLGKFSGALGTDPSILPHRVLCVLLDARDNGVAAKIPDGREMPTTGHSVPLPVVGPDAACVWAANPHVVEPAGNLLEAAPPAPPFEHHDPRAELVDVVG